MSDGQFSDEVIVLIMTSRWDDVIFAILLKDSANFWFWSVGVSTMAFLTSSSVNSNAGVYVVTAEWILLEVSAHFLMSS